MSSYTRSPLTLGQVRAARAAATAALRYLPSFAQASHGSWTRQALYACQKPSQSPGRTVAASYAAAVRQCPPLTTPAPSPALQACADLLELHISHSLSFLRMLQGLPAGLLSTLPQSSVPFPHPFPPSPTAPRRTPTPRSTPTPSPSSPAPPTQSSDAGQPSHPQPACVSQQLEDVWAAIAELRHSGQQIRELVDEHQQRWACELLAVQQRQWVDVDMLEDRLGESRKLITEEASKTRAIMVLMDKHVDDWQAELRQDVASNSQLVEAYKQDLREATQDTLALRDLVEGAVSAKLRQHDEDIARCQATVELILADQVVPDGDSVPCCKSKARATRKRLA